MRVLDLFAGIGGFTYAGQLLGGFTTLDFVEIDPYCQKVLRKNYPNVPIHDDITTFDTSFRFGEYDLITAGFPCQDLSIAGRQAGLQDGTRSALFYEVIRIARKVRPRFILFENVRHLLSHQNGQTFQEVLFQIAKAGYNAEWGVVSAKDVGACHKRERIWIIAYANDPRYHRPSKCQANTQRQTTMQQRQVSQLEPTGQTDHATDTDSIRRGGGHSQRCTVREQPLLQREQAGGTLGSQTTGRSSTPTNTHSQRLQGQWGQYELRESSQKIPIGWSPQPHTLNPDWRGYEAQPTLCRGDAGLSNRVARLKALGNTICPQSAAIPLGRIKELDALLQHS